MLLLRNVLRVTLSVAAVSGGLVASSGCHEEKKAVGAPPPPTVLFAQVERRDVPMFIEAVASVDGYVNAEIRARVRGYLKTQDYKEGSIVKQGQRLFTIEQAEYDNALANAKSAVARAKAAQERDHVQYQRDLDLYKTGVVSRQDVDNAAASVADADGQVAGAQAQLDQAQLNLSYTVMTSPIEGVAGVASVRVGNLVGQDGPTLLTTVSQIDPIRVNFPISEVEYVKYPERFKDLSMRDLNWARKQFKQLENGTLAEHGDPGIELQLSDGSIYPKRGVIVTANRQIDANTGTIQLQALVPNPDGFLRPGQYARVRVPKPNEGRNVLVVPDIALISVQGSYSVGVIGGDNKVALHRVEVGPSVDGLRVIASGVNEGDKIVVEGVQKISDGATVVPKPAPPPAADGGGAASNGAPKPEGQPSNPAPNSAVKLSAAKN
jgi:membrane fusion protein (multidrug efflux system)